MKITDPTAVAESVLMYEMDVINLANTDFEYRQVIVPLSECRLIYQRTSGAMRTRSAIYESFESCFILGPHARGCIDDTDLRPYSMIVAGPGAQGELIIDSGYENIGWIVPPHILDRHLALRGKNRSFSIPENHGVWHPKKEVARELFELGARIIAIAENTPEVFDDNHWARYGAQVEFMDSLLATIESCKPDKSAVTEEKGTSYSHIVQACEDYTLNLGGRRPYLSELCAAAKVGKRTLQYAFQDIIGMPPMSYLQRLRLHRARDELRRAKSGSTTVSEVAMNWGFWHFGEFSRAYKKCFAETPSHTLRHNS